jgi:micrococcal nuclease
MPQGKQVEVVRVISGQTVEVRGLEADEPQEVRLIGIEAPDLKQEPWGLQAKQGLETLLAGRSVLLESDIETHDRFDRQLGYLWVGGVLANEQILKNGYVLEATRSPNVKYQKRLSSAQRWARLMGNGIWHSQTPLRQTPAQFRQENDAKRQRSIQEKQPGQGKTDRSQESKHSAVSRQPITDNRSLIADN